MDDPPKNPADIFSPEPATFQFINYDVRSIGTLSDAKFQWKNMSSPTNMSSIPIIVENDDKNKDQDLVEITTNVDVSIIPDDEDVNIMLSFTLLR